MPSGERLTSKIKRLNAVTERSSSGLEYSQVIIDMCILKQQEGDMHLSAKSTKTFLSANVIGQT